jgi:hypothetical protein
VPLKAVEVNADSHQFPEDWLFRWRWSKGKKQAKGSKKSKKVEEEEGSADGLRPAGKDFLALVSPCPKIAYMAADDSLMGRLLRLISLKLEEGLPL